MKIAVIGATGFVGKAVVNELLSRGVQVKAIARHPETIETKNPNLTLVTADVFDTDQLAGLVAGSDAVISAYNPGWTNPAIYNDTLKGAGSIEKAVEDSGVKRLLVVGGAGSLVINGSQLVDSPDFPAAYKVAASGARDYLNILRKNEKLDWTFISPAINLHPGERTGKFRLGTDEPVFDEKGNSSISVEDMAVAIADEIEKNQFIKRRFTVGY